jgi:hypothetical protein
METINKKMNQNKQIFDSNRKYNSNKFNNYNSLPIKIYFPSISLNAIKDIIIQNNKIGSKSYISKYLVDESKKIIIYGNTGIFEIINNNLYQLYPVDKIIKELTINNNLKILVDTSYMRRNETPSYQIPYYHIIKNKTFNTYKLDIKSKVKLIIEMENDNVCDFYITITSEDININNKNEIEINKFIKDEIMSFLLKLNLYR